MLKSEKIEEILKIIKNKETFLICSHANPDGDSIGSQLAFYSLLIELGKKAYVLNANPMPSNYEFLPYSDAHQTQLNSVNTNDIDLAIILDCANLDRVGKELLEKIKILGEIVNIDHHTSNDYFGNYNLVDPTAGATAEIIFRFIKQSGLSIGYERAVCLYTGILFDTGCFKYTNTSPETHRIAAELIESGVKPDKINQLVYDIPYRKARLFSMAIQTLQISDDGKVAWMSVTNDMYKKSRANSADTEGFVDYIRSLSGIEVAVFLRETDKDVKVSFRSKSDDLAKQAINVENIAKEFGGGGHPTAAGCNIDKPLEVAINLVLEKVHKALALTK
ncbi:MAG: DHH family phosphoesterase [Candidatus Poribacteria bacterium]